MLYVDVNTWVAYASLESFGDKALGWISTSVLAGYPEIATYIVYLFLGWDAIQIFLWSTQCACSPLKLGASRRILVELISYEMHPD